MCLGYDLGHGNISGCVPFSINDGNWHKVDAAVVSVFTVFINRRIRKLFLLMMIRSRSGGRGGGGGVMFVLTLVVSSSPQIRVSRNKQRCLLMVDGRYSKQMISPKKVDE